MQEPSDEQVERISWSVKPVSLKTFTGGCSVSKHSLASPWPEIEKVALVGR